MVSACDHSRTQAVVRDGAAGLHNVASGSGGVVQARDGGADAGGVGAGLGAAFALLDEAAVGVVDETSGGLGAVQTCWRHNVRGRRMNPTINRAREPTKYQPNRRSPRRCCSRLSFENSWIILL